MGLVDLNATVIIPSVNRAEMLHDSVLSIMAQTVKPSRLILSLDTMEDVLPIAAKLQNVEIVTGHRGSATKRNMALARVNDEKSIIFFFDDDVELEPHYIEEMLKLFAERPSIVLASGNNIALGAAPGTITRAHARHFTQSATYPNVKFARVLQTRSGVGCHMCVRGSVATKFRFDERLVLYGYLEDYDFSLQCAKYGLVVKNMQAQMVHLEATAGRVGNKKRGYSEVINPFYILSKRTGASRWRTCAQVLHRLIG